MPTASLEASPTDELFAPTSVVVAVDGSEHAARAVRWAADQARLERRGLVVVSVADVGRHASVERADALRGPALHVARALRDDARRRAEEAADLARRTAPDLAITPLPLDGDPRDILVALSRRAHLLVLGSRGRGSVLSAMLGSVSASVCKHAACPVVVCRPGATRVPARGIVVGADGTPESRPVIEFAFAQAALHGLPLTVLHSFWDAVVAVEHLRGRGSAAPESAGVAASLDDLRLALATSVAGMAERYPDVPLDQRLAHGLVDEVILGQNTDWDLVVVGRHPWSSVTRCLTGSVALSILEQAHTTVAVVPEPAVGTS